MTESVSLAMCSNVPSSLCDLFWPQLPSEKNVVNTCVSLAHGYLGGLNEISAERLLQKLKAWANSREDCVESEGLGSESQTCHFLAGLSCCLTFLNFACERRPTPSTL